MSANHLSLQVKAALLTGDFGLFQRLSFSWMYNITLRSFVFRLTTNILQNTTRGVKGFQKVFLKLSVKAAALRFELANSSEKSNYSYDWVSI
ncbi:MAG: hypothetical protein V7K14_08385 [Nostoc sp.]|uniref:hypothetical protein n=1 Tax=Nostoc sp. TaxID=1180 RepID=UPI002FF6D35E